MMMQMAIAAIAHVFVFSTKPYNFVPASSGHGKVTKETIEATLDIDEGGEQKPAVLKETTTQVEAPRTSVKESVQDIVVEGGQRVSSLHNIEQVVKDVVMFIFCIHINNEQVVKDVVLTINQAIGPVEKGVTKIQQTLHQKTVVSSDDEEEESDIEIETNVTENLTARKTDDSAMV